MGEKVAIPDPEDDWTIDAAHSAFLSATGLNWISREDIRLTLEAARRAQTADPGA